MRKKIIDFLNSNWFEVLLLFILFGVVLGTFYWYEWRPTQIKKECLKENPGAFSGLSGFLGDNAKAQYEKCLIEHRWSE
jgi:hypothetical protein